MSEWIGVTFTSEHGWNHLETLVDLGNRMAGSDGEYAGAEATRDALETVGARNAHLVEFDIPGWTRGSSSIDTPATTEACIALPRSPAGDVTAELIDIGYGLPEDFETDLAGKIVQVRTNVPDWADRFIHRREKYYRAVDAGAAGFIFHNHIEGCLPPTGSIGMPDAPIGEIPGIGVSSEVGARLERRWAGEEIAVTVDANIHDATSHNIHAELGPDTDEAVLLTSHVDAHDIAEGAWDNGAGTAIVVDAARALAQREDDLETRVELLVYGAEEVGLLGSAYDAEVRDLETVKAIVNLDGVGRGRTLKAYTHAFEGLDEAAKRVSERLDQPIERSPRLGPHSDHWPYVQQGVPGYHFMSVTGAEGRGWGHTAADTLDKIEARNIREQAIVLTELVVELAKADVTIDRRPTEDIAAQLEAEDLAEGMRLTGDWPY